MLKHKLKIFLFAFILSLIIVSYTEKLQMTVLMPIRDFIVVPSVKIENIKKVQSDNILQKTSKDGLYINPYTTASSFRSISHIILKNGCVNIDEKNKNKLIKYAKYFYESAEKRMYEDAEFVVWPYPIKFSYGLEPGWISGLAQGEVAVMLMAASKCTNDEKLILNFKDYSDKAILSLTILVKNGGVLVKKDGNNWYEEYAQKGVESPLVLNGHNYVLFALEILKKHNEKATVLFDSGLDALRKSLGQYDIITWSYYDSVGYPANQKYQRTHARQMKKLYKLTNDSFFYNYYNKFTNQRLFPFSSIQRFIIKPSRFLGGLIIVDTVIFYFLLLILWREDEN